MGGLAAFLGKLLGGSDPYADGAARPASQESSSQPGFVDGRHFTEHVDRVKALRREGNDAAAEDLLLRLVNATEAEAAAEGFGVAPWYYEQLAIIYRSRKSNEAEVAILERYASQVHAPGVKPAQLLERLEKAKSRA